MTTLNHPPLWAQDRKYPALSDRQLIDALYQDEGVITGFRVRQTSIPSFTLEIDAGSAVIQGDDYLGQGKYLQAEDSITSLIVTDGPPGSNSRLDLIVLRVYDDSSPGASATARIERILGATAATPVVPSLPTNAIPLAAVLITAATVSISNSAIIDMRPVALLRGEEPPGSLIAYTGNEARIGAGYALADGGLSSRVTDWRLFRYISTLHGTGDGTSTFNRPNAKGRTPVGLDNMGGVPAGVAPMVTGVGLGSAGYGGAYQVALVIDQIPAHNHAASVIHSVLAPSGVHSHPTTTISTEAAHTHNGTGTHAHSIDDPGHWHEVERTTDQGGFGGWAYRLASLPLPEYSQAYYAPAVWSALTTGSPKRTYQTQSASAVGLAAHTHGVSHSEAGGMSMFYVTAPALAKARYLSVSGAADGTGIVVNNDSSSEHGHGSAGSHDHDITINDPLGHTHDLHVAPTGSGQAHTNMQPWIGVLMLVKT
jgi:microcystin-dependent protein